MLIGLVSLCAACEPIPLTSDLAYQSTMSIATKGMVLHADGTIGHAGMYGTNCPFETRHGRVTGDYDLPGRDEEVQDAGPSHLGQTTVVLVQDGTDVHLLFKEDGAYTHEQVPIAGVRQARLWDDGLVVLRDGVIEWRDATGAVVDDVAVPSSSALDVDPRSGLVALAADGDLVLATPGQVDRAGVAGELLSVDVAADAIYTADRGAAEVSALELDGSPRWAVEVPGEVRALAHAGAMGAVAVIVALPDERGGVVYLDGADGHTVAWQETPTSADGVSVSDDGSTVAFILPHAVHFFGLADDEG